MSWLRLAGGVRILRELFAVDACRPELLEVLRELRGVLEEEQHKVLGVLPASPGAQTQHTTLVVLHELV